MVCAHTLLRVSCTCSPTSEPGSSRVSRYREVFNVRLQSESESKEEIEEDESTYEDEGTCVWFRLDTAPESGDTDEDDEILAACLEGPRLARGEEVHQLDDLGSSILSVVAKDNIKAMALKTQSNPVDDTNPLFSASLLAKGCVHLLPLLG